MNTTKSHNHCGLDKQRGGGVNQRSSIKCGAIKDMILCNFSNLKS